jgi:hypothetical protein
MVLARPIRLERRLSSQLLKRVIGHAVADQNNVLRLIHMKVPKVRLNARNVWYRPGATITH